ncbi:hypothetical protein AQUCO_00200368v1 [Aquilegia coerulea]|uniref:Uncharacterized protein n=1 Tax=Aquilegia coerulea TaxID=218851 RepID=A0A2G5F2V3_AQUCA|nr:hypothetical protein AQUCO_00200368v1 [Aquilegia coerulea]
MRHLYGSRHFKQVRRGSLYLNAMFYHQLEESHEQLYSYQWQQAAFSKLTKMSDVLQNVDLIDGKLVKVDDGSAIIDECMVKKLYKFKSLCRTFLGSPSIQQGLKERAVASVGSIPKGCFSKPNEREPMTLNTLTKVCNFLDVSAQQRKSVRFTTCPQVSEHRIWTETLEEILNGLKSEVELLNHGSFSRGARMSEQIISSCLKFLADTSISFDPEATSWMRITPAKKVYSSPSRTWGHILEMFIDLTKCLESEKSLLYHLSKIEVMKEGLYQIKDVLVDKDIGYKEALHQESLVQKKLSKTLGHSSQCLFTLLQYYLYGSVRDLEVEISGGVYKGTNKDAICLYIGKVLTSDAEKAVWLGVKQLDMALGLFKFIWDSAGMKGTLELQGHLWYVGTENKTLTYRGHNFFLHGISL